MIFLTYSREYTKVPPMRKDDNIIPSASEIPSMLSSFRHPRRRRISVGPQSEADAREFFANREHQRKASRPSNSPRGDPERKPLPSESVSELSDAVHATSSTSSKVSEHIAESAINRNLQRISGASLQADSPNKDLLAEPIHDTQEKQDSDREEAKSDREMVSGLEKPRTHYDVEVITKLVVYAGEFMSWILSSFNMLTRRYRHCMACGRRQPNLV